jgi:hypothetical protein
MKWEYMTAEIEGLTDEILTEEFGSKGWELVAIF